MDSSGKGRVARLWAGAFVAATALVWSDMAEATAQEREGPVESDGLWSAMCVQDDQEAERVAQLLGREMDSAPGALLMRFRRLLSEAGSDFYLHFQREGPFTVVVEATRLSRASLEIEAGRTRGSLSATVTSENCGYPAGIVVFWVKGTAQPEYHVKVPSGIERVIVVAGPDKVAEMGWGTANRDLIQLRVP